jgi:hypothetical protein
MTAIMASVSARARQQYLTRIFFSPMCRVLSFCGARPARVSAEVAVDAGTDYVKFIKLNNELT